MPDALIETFQERLERATGADYVSLLLNSVGHARVTPTQLKRIEEELAEVSEEVILNTFPDDAVLSNFALNMWELAHGKEVLKSKPWNISLPISDLCNARCSFCTSWLDGKKLLSIEQLEMFEPVLRTAVYVGLVGHGEPLSHPQFPEICERLDSYLDPRAASYTITNGVYLARLLDRLDKIRLASISCSLNAASGQTHAEVMGFPEDEFPRIVESLRTIASGQASSVPINVSITMVVTRQNLHEIPAFIDLAHELRVTSVYLRTLLPQGQVISGLNYHLLPAYLHPDFERHRENARAAIAASQVPVYAEVDTWSNPIFPDEVARSIEISPPAIVSRQEAVRNKEWREQRNEDYAASGQRHTGAANPALDGDLLKDGNNPLNRQAPFRCRAVYNNLYVNELFLRMSPCCYLTRTPGHDQIRLPDLENIMDGWNSEALRNLRRTLDQGPLYGACERCPAAW